MKFNDCEVKVRDPQTGISKIDKAKTETFLVFHAYGQPDVFYAQKANKYFKNQECTKEFTTAELEKLELPFPTVIEAARNKLIAEANKSGKLVTMDEIVAATSPQSIQPRADIRERLSQATPEDRMVQRLNSASNK